MALSDDATKMIITVAVFSVLSTLCLALRLVMRSKSKMLGADDYLLVFALFAGYLDSAGALVLCIKGGMGKPFLTLTPDEGTTLLKMLWMIELGYPLTVCAIKLSILVSYGRIFTRVEWMRWPLYILGFLSVGWACGHFFTAIFQCTPVDKAWDPLLPGHCIDLQAFIRGNAIPNTIIDYMILLLPTLPVWRLQMGVFQKILVSGSLGLGLIACAASTARAATTSTVNFEDLSQTIFLNTIWIYVEPTAGVIAACLPMFTGAGAGHVRSFLSPMSKNSNSTYTEGSDVTYADQHRHHGPISRRDSFTVIFDDSDPKSQYELVEKGIDQRGMDAQLHAPGKGQSPRRMV